MPDIKEQCQTVLAHVVNYWRCLSDNDDKFQRDIAKLPGSTTLEELALDDLDLMDFIYRIEDQLQVQLDDDALTLKSDLDTLFNAVQNALRHKQAA